jgi:anti-sigma regulatory factor (Ser/Thr protein kinase)
MAENVTVEFPSDYKYLNIVDLVCNELVEDMGFNHQSANEISISVVEACTNALEHGNKCCVDCNVRAVFTMLPDRLVVEVCDCGEGFDFEDYLKHIPDPSNIHHQRGRGIYIMQRMMDTLDFEMCDGEGMKVKLEKMLCKEHAEKA